MTKPTLDQELRSLAAAVQTKYPKPAQDLRFDYERQAWVVDGRYVRCGHETACQCYGRLHEGEQAANA